MFWLLVGFIIFVLDILISFEQMLDDISRIRNIKRDMETMIGGKKTSLMLAEDLHLNTSERERDREKIKTLITLE